MTYHREYLCTLLNGRDIYQGDSIYHPRFSSFVTADSTFKDVDGDVFLCFKEGGNAFVYGPGESFYRDRYTILLGDI